jgi:hypothetical protein
MSLGRILIAFGATALVAGILVEFVPWLRPGRLPGDLSFGNGNVRVFLPLGTSLVLSVVLTLVLMVLARR